MARKKILAIQGSTRTNSSNEAILKTLANLYPDRLDVHLYAELSDLPYFNPDLDNENVPEAVKNFRNHIEEADGVIICTPEYVFSLPGVLKNAIEWTVSTMVFSSKPLAIIVAAGNGEKTFESLSLIMETVGAEINPGCKLLLQGARGKITDGKIADEYVLDSIKKLVESFMVSMG